MGTVSVDREMCLGVGNCEHVAPKVFAIDHDSVVRFVGDDTTGPIPVPPDEQEAVERAAETCPSAAILLNKEQA